MRRLFSSDLRYSIPRWTSDAYHAVRYALQRVHKGYDDRMVFDFHSQFADMAIRALTELKDCKHGYPASMANIDEWHGVLEAIIRGFEGAKGLDEARNWGIKNSVLSKKKDELDRRDFEEGMALFVRHFFNLWD